MNGYLIILFIGTMLLVLPGIWVIGLFEPKYILRWVKKPTRLKVTGWWLLSELLCFGACCLYIGISFNNSMDPLVQELHPQMNKTGKWGYVEKRKKVIPYLYDEAEEFNNGLAKVKINGKYGFINKKGEVVLPLIYDEIEYDEAEKFDNGLAKVKINGKYGFINIKGEVVLSLIYDEIETIPVQINGTSRVKLNNKYGLLDLTRKLIVQPIYDEMGRFDYEWAEVKLDGKKGFIDKDGYEVIPPIYDDIGKFQNNLAPVKSNGKFGYINMKGEIVIPIQYDQAENFVNGYANVVLAGDIGKIDTSGKFTLQFMKISLIEAVKKKYVRFSANGGSVESSNINIENLSDIKLHLIIPAGTFLNANSSGCQNMVLTNPQDIILDAGRNYSGSVSTACMNIHRNIPHGDNTFGLAQRADNHLLSKVIRVINNGNYSYSVIQAAVWIVTDGATYSGMGILQDQTHQRVIDYEDYKNALSIVNEARKLK